MRPNQDNQRQRPQQSSSNNSTPIGVGNSNINDQRSSSSSSTPSDRKQVTTYPHITTRFDIQNYFFWSLNFFVAQK